MKTPEKVFALVVIALATWGACGIIWNLMSLIPRCFR